MRPSPANELTRKGLLNLIHPNFSEEGSNARRFANALYNMFSKYVREVACGRREGIQLGNMPQFITRADEEPPLGFKLPRKKLQVAFSTNGQYLHTNNVSSNSIS